MSSSQQVSLFACKKHNPNPLKNFQETPDKVPWYHNGGASTSARFNPLRYRGYYYDTETGLYYLNSRYYDSVAGRFINADGYISTGQGLLGFNMFAYCGNNPVMFFDYFGNCPHTLLGNDCISCLSGDSVDGNSIAGSQSPLFDIDESLYDSHRFNNNPPSFRERMFGIIGNNPKIEFNSGGAFINLIDYTVYFYKAGWYNNSWSLDGTLGQASVTGYLNASRNAQKKQGVDLGVISSVLSGELSFNIWGINIELNGEFISAGAGVEITNKRFGFYCGLGWFGGGISISWD